MLGKDGSDVEGPLVSEAGGGRTRPRETGQAVACDVGDDIYLQPAQAQLGPQLPTWKQTSVEAPEQPQSPL
ncbi:hypothetical protein ACRALDRAFT_2056216 [Sodiomyces alcalophilus JCM 7366]|uniref:uncharacterized protein n=1 Tax=Sodiomyces alcalophilus JCM 7366 TaxID=591952 RepID=UPI0039B6D15B